jgi:hypothetical protein
MQCQLLLSEVSSHSEILSLWTVQPGLPQVWSLVFDITLTSVAITM